MCAYTTRRGGTARAGARVRRLTEWWLVIEATDRSLGAGRRTERVVCHIVRSCG